jgi:hypothetical protein
MQIPHSQHIVSSGPLALLIRTLHQEAGSGVIMAAVICKVEDLLPQLRCSKYERDDISLCSASLKGDESSLADVGLLKTADFHVYSNKYYNNNQAFYSQNHIAQTITDVFLLSRVPLGIPRPPLAISTVACLVSR